MAPFLHPALIQEKLTDVTVQTKAMLNIWNVENIHTGALPSVSTVFPSRSLSLMGWSDFFSHRDVIVMLQLVWLNTFL